MSNVTIHVSDVDITCPVCGAPEVDLNATWTSKHEPKGYHPFWIRAYKVDNYHHCTWCDTWFNDEGNIERGPHAGRIGPWISQPQPAEA